MTKITDLRVGDEAPAYVDEVRERFMNPFLAHRLADIASNHDEKKASTFRSRHCLGRASATLPAAAEASCRLGDYR